MEHKDETLSIAWCDNGSVDSLFMGGMVNALLNLENIGIKRGSVHNIIGNQIHKQRQHLIDEWERTGHDWLLWVDSDVVINKEIVQLLWETADKDTKPVVCGIYFVSPNPNFPLMTPVPCVFTYDNGYNTPIHPLPANKVIQIDVAGLGLCLMHKSVIEKLKEPYKGIYFDVTISKDEMENKGEDVSFFLKLKEQGIPVYAHTAALAQHIKRFVFDHNYYSLWWNSQAKI
jgi:hypothetical protein